MSLLNLWKRFRRDFRKELRLRPHPEVRCFIQHVHQDTFQEGSPEACQEAWICDVSKSGLGFLTRAPGFEIDQRVTTYFNMGSSIIASMSGMIVGQDVLYFGPHKDIEKSYLRFSISFDANLNEDQLLRLKNV
jgi:hypothetical protein